VITLRITLRITMYPTTPEPVARSSSSHPDADEAGRRWAAKVFTTVAGLDTVGRDAVRMIYRHGLTQAQVAARLGVAESTVRAEVAGALRVLSASLLRPESGS
jgi:DNA-directed RNA polymerase specialized sigma24 family protein